MCTHTQVLEMTKFIFEQKSEKICAQEVELLEYSNGFCEIYNPGQNIVDKSTKLSKIGFSMKWFTVDFSQFYNTTVEICLLCGRLNTFLSIPSVSGISLKFPNFLRS